MSTRVDELLEAAEVLSGAGDRGGALRLVDEALRLAPGHAGSLALRMSLVPPVGHTPTPFAPPPEDLFADAQRKVSANPFARRSPDEPVTAPPGAAQALAALLGGAREALPADAAQAPLPAGRPPGMTDPYASEDMRPPPPVQTLGFGQPADSEPPSGQTLVFGQGPARKPTAPVPMASHPPANDPPSGKTLVFGQGPHRDPASSPGTARAGTMLAGEPFTPTPTRTALEPAAAPGLARPSSGSKREEAAGSRPSSGGKGKTRPSSGGKGKTRPSSGGKGKRPTSQGAARPKSNDPMALIDEPRTPGSAGAIEQMLRQARELLAFADHSGALERVEQVLVLAPSHTEALALRARCEATLTSMFESKLGDLSARPKLKLRPDEVIWLNLDHRAGFVLAQIDGQISLDDIFDLSGMSRLDTARILAQLVEEKVIDL